MHDDVVDGIVCGAGVRSGVERDPKRCEREPTVHTEEVHAMSSGEDHVLGDERPGAEAEPLALEQNLPVTNVPVNVTRVLLAADDRVGPGNPDNEGQTETGDSTLCEGRQA
jgi:hypothetical protein